MRKGALITLLALGAGLSAAPANAAEYNVTVRSNAYEPQDITVTQGDVVTWTFAAPDHTVSSDEPGKQGSFDSDSRGYRPKEIGEKFSFDMNFPGEFKYTCQIHPEMTGRVTVTPKPNDPNPPANDFAAPKFATPKVALKKREVRLTLDEDARVTAKLRGPTTATIRIDGKAGPNVIKLPKKLKAGRYAAVVWATDALRNRSKAKTVKFRVR